MNQKSTKDVFAVFRVAKIAKKKESRIEMLRVSNLPVGSGKPKKMADVDPQYTYMYIDI
jgi:hypothetical protein